MATVEETGPLYRRGPELCAASAARNALQGAPSELRAGVGVVPLGDARSRRKEYGHRGRQRVAAVQETVKPCRPPFSPIWGDVSAKVEHRLRRIDAADKADTDPDNNA